MKIIVAPDKFKGSLSTFEVCDAIANGIYAINEGIEVVKFPLADGGDGFASVMKSYLLTQTITCETVDPMGRPIKASYEWDEKNKTAIIEVAAASGLVLVSSGERDPTRASTLGTGLQVGHAIAIGARRIVLGLGGSATNDGGIGILKGLGYEFLDEQDEVLPAIGSSLQRINRVSPPASLPDIVFEVASDVTNTLLGPNGASYIYGPQKGANPEMVKQLDDGLRNFSKVVKASRGIDITEVPGTGAAGGIAAGLMGYFSVEIRSGIDMVAAASRIEESLLGADLVITGEGKIDAQSSEGKLVSHIAHLSKKYEVPCVAICGMLEAAESEWRALGLKNVVSIRPEGMSLEESMNRGGELIQESVRLILI